MSRRKAWARVWHGLTLRERRVVGGALAVLLLAALWGLAVAPALRTVRSAPAQLDALDSQLQAMQRLAAEAKTMQGGPVVSRDEALRALESSLQQGLGATAQFSVAGDRVTVTLKGAAPDVLARWIAQARTGARAVARQASLARGPNGWDGSVVLELPPS